MNTIHQLLLILIIYIIILMYRISAFTYFVRLSVNHFVIISSVLKIFDYFAPRWPKQFCPSQPEEV